MRGKEFSSITTRVYVCVYIEAAAKWYSRLIGVRACTSLSDVRASCDVYARRMSYPRYMDVVTCLSIEKSGTKCIRAKI